MTAINSSTDDLLVTRLQSFYSQHQTTDDSTSIDYDYSLEDVGEATHYDLPLIPITNDNNTSASKEPPELDVDDQFFRDQNVTQDSESVSSTVAALIPPSSLINLDITINNETENQENFSTEKNIAVENRNETRVNESDINSDETDTTTVDESVVDTTPVFSLSEDLFEDESNYTTTAASDEIVINESEKPQAEKIISSDTIASHLGDYFDAMLLNDSLLIDDSFSYENTTDSDFDVTTGESFSDFTTESDGLGELLNEEKALTELLSKIKAEADKASSELLSISEKTSPTSQPSFPLYVTVEETSSVVKGPFLVFSEPFSKPSSVEKDSQKLSIVESSKNENFTNTNFKIPTVDTLTDDETTKTLKKSSTSSETSAKNEDVNLPITIAQTTVSPTSQILTEFAPNLFPYENRIIKDDQQNSELENVEEANKFVYHHLPSSEVSSTVRFPINSEQRVRFPDEPSTRNPPASFSWPRDNGGLMRFWQDQPLINDFKFFSRANSRGSNGNFHRHMSYRRNYR